MYYINAIIVFTDTRMLKWLNVMKVEIYLCLNYTIYVTHLYMYMCSNIFINTHFDTYIHCTYIHTYIPTYIHTYLHTHTC